jgi:hypothetical protein
MDSDAHTHTHTHTHIHRTIAHTRARASCARAACSQEAGNATDNPRWPYLMTAAHKRRAVVIALTDVSTFDVLLSVSTCCVTGRNFLCA